jgi:hypothetical protein
VLTKKRFVFIPIIIFMAVVPLIVFLKEIPLIPGTLSYEAWPSGRVNIDFFSYYKSWWIIGTGAFAWFLFLWQYDLKEGKYNMFYIPILTYIILIIFSTALSPYREVAIKGVSDRYENIFVLIAYLVTTLVIINIVNREIDVKLLINFLILSAIIAATIGILQYFGYDFFQSNIGQSLMLPAEKEELVGRLAFRFGIYNIYSTMYNTNYVGSYMVMILMIVFSMYINSGKEEVKKDAFKSIKNFYNCYFSRIAYGLLTLLIFSNWVGSRSRAGIIGGIVAMAIMLVIMRRKVLKNIGYIAIVVVSCYGIFQGMNFASKGTLFGKVSTITKEAKDISGKKEVNVKVKDIYTEGNSVIIEKSTKKDSIKITYDINEKLMYSTSLTGERIAVTPKDDYYEIEKAGYEKYKIKTYDNGVFDIITEIGGIRLIATEEGIKYYGKRGVEEPLLGIKDIERVKIADGKEKVGSGRVFIWSRTLPLLKSRMIYGSGPDTFSLAFPQYDHIGKLKTFHNPEIIVDKPHNMYLQMAVNTGVMSLVAFLLLMGVYFTTGLKAYFNSNYETYMEKIGVGILLAMAGYCTAGMFNDSLVSVAPVFWGLLGIGTAVNMINLKYDVNKVKQDKK